MTEQKRTKSAIFVLGWLIFASLVTYVHLLTNIIVGLLQVITLDARNHGDSPHINEMSTKLMSSDVISFLNRNNIARCVLIGHSMGGRTAMLTALQWPKLIKSLIVVDVSPVPSPGETN